MTALEKLVVEARYQAESWAEAARRTAVAKRAADDCAREEAHLKSRTFAAIEELSKHALQAPSATPVDAPKENGPPPEERRS